MPARRRRRPGGVEPAPDLSTRQGRRTAQATAAQVFADRQRAEREEQGRLARERNEARARERRRQELVEAKERAAARLRDVRRRGLPGAVRIEADEAYRAALDALLRDEQGLPPIEEEAAEPDGTEEAAEGGEGAIEGEEAEGESVDAEPST